jgi:hypothetical protein
MEIMKFQDMGQEYKAIYKDTGVNSSALLLVGDSEGPSVVWSDEDAKNGRHLSQVFFMGYIFAHYMLKQPIKGSGHLSDEYLTEIYAQI